MQTKFYIFLVVPLIFIVLLFVVSNYFFLVPSIEREITTQKKEIIKELTNVSLSIIGDYNHNYLQGLYSLEEAKQRAGEKIRKMSYGEDKKDYFWIIDTTTQMIMHPFRMDLEGKNLSTYQDPEGNFLFKTAVEIVQQKNEGYLEYIWQWKDDSTLLLPKLTFVKAFKDWGWIVGTGVYTNDMKEEIDNIRKKQIRIVLFSFGLITLMTISIFLFGVKTERNRKIAHNKLVHSEEKFRNLFHNSKDLIIISDFNGVILEINHKGLNRYGVSKEMFVGKKTFDFIAEKYHQAILDRIQQLVNTELPPVELEFYLQENHLIYAEINSSVFNYEGNKAILSVIRDITDRKNHEQQLMNAIITGEENERARLAKEIHDGLGPFLSTIKLYFQWLSESDDPKKRTGIVEKGIENITEAIAVLREISNNLNPHILINYGLTEAIQSFIKKFEDNKQLRIKFFPIKNDRFNSHVEIALYRAIIELINNTIKHAYANEIVITFEYLSQSQIKITYSDNGQGFEYSPEHTKGKGLGLINIINRINSLNGDIKIETSPGKGFTACITINQ